MRPMTALAAFAIYVFAPLNALAVELYSEFPMVIRSDERYVIFSHGRIAEGDDPRPVHPTRGVYDLPAIRAAIFEDGGFNLIAHQRPKDADMKTYIDILESWTRRLLDAGVAPSRITLVGFSRGGHITAYASGRLAANGINTAIMGACSDGDIPRDPPLKLGGHVLSIYETTDEVRSCSKLAERSALSSFKEVAITTGREHAAFFIPMREWVQPLRAWIAVTNR